MIKIEKYIKIEYSFGKIIYVIYEAQATVFR